MTPAEFEKVFGESLEHCLNTCKFEKKWGGSCNCLGCRFKRQMADPTEAHRPDTAYAKRRMEETPNNYVLYNGFVLWCL
jgi:hypothetical protein